MSGSPDVLTRPWPLTGRHEDLDAICLAIEEGCRAFSILGEAGSGKTRLAREALRRLEQDGWPTAGATATDSARSTPLGALAHLLPPGAAADPATVFQATSDAIAARAAGQPLVLHVDDAHHLDPSSAALLVSLAEAGTVRLILTLRSGLRVPDAVTSLRAADHASSLTLGALDPTAIDTLLHRVLGAPLDGMAEAQLLQISGGNPLYLRELVLGALADGSLREVSGVWRLRGNLPASEALGDRVLGRLATLGDDAHAALELVAVAEPIGLDLLETMLDPTVLEDLETRGLIRVDQEQRRHQVRLGHPVYGEILRGSLGRVRLRRLSRQVAEAVAARGARRSGDAARIVRWQIDAGLTPDIDVVMAGARLARHHQDWSATATLARIALDAGHHDAAAYLVEAHFALGEFAEGEAVAAEAMAQREQLSEAAYVGLLRTRADSLFFGQDDAAGAVAAVHAAAETIADPGLRELLTFSEAAMLVWSARIAEATALTRDLLDSDDPRVAVQAAMVDEAAAATCGPATTAIELADRWFPIHLALPDLAGTNSPGFHMVIKTVALANAGRLDDAAALAELGYGASVAERNLVGQMWFSLELGRVALLRGDAAGAERWYREQVALCRSTGWRRPLTLGLSGLAIAAAQRGDGDGAARAIAERTASGLSVIELFAIEGVRGEAWALAAGGDPESARRTLVAGAAAAEADGLTLQAALARLDALRLGATDQAEPLAAAALTSASTLVDLAARWAAATTDAVELQAVAAGFEELGALMIAAEVLAAAAGALRKAGDPRGATAAEHRADELARRCSAAATPTAVLTVTDAVVPLTAREREICVLVADGLSTKEVAERLYLSARTVSNHLQNAYTKLGVSKRAELAGALHRLGTGQGGAS